MRRPLPFLLTFLALLTASFLYAQTTQTEPSATDDMPFALIFWTVFGSTVLGCIIIGAIGMTIVLTGIFGLVTAGIISSSILVGLYKRSVAAAFKSLLLITCGIGGAVTGIFGLWAANRLFHIWHLSTSNIAWIGVAGGLAGGIVLALSILGLIRLFLAFATKKLSLRAD